MRSVRRGCLIASFLGLGMGHVLADMPETIARIKPSIVAVGTYNKTASPQFVLRGTGFVVGEGVSVATNAHVVPDPVDGDNGTVLAVQVSHGGTDTQLRRVLSVTKDKDHDLALLRIAGTPLPYLHLRNSDTVREGQTVGFTGFPIGGALGFSPVTHRGMVSAITPIALPSPTAQQLNARVIRRLKDGAFNIFQLDATAYPGNSGSPVFDVETGEVLGIINMVFIKTTKEAALSQPSGISYAIPANFLQEMLAQGR